MKKRPTSAVLSLGYFLYKDIPQTITNLEEMGITRVCVLNSRKRWFTTTELRNYLKPLSEDTYLVVKE